MLPLLLQLDEGTRILGVGVGVFLFGLAVVLAVAICAAGKVAEQGCAGVAGGVAVVLLIVLFIAIAPRESASTTTVTTAIDYDDNGLALNFLLITLIVTMLGSCGCWVKFYGSTQRQGIPLDNYVGS